MYDIKELNEQQLIPATQSEGAFLVTAGAGSGKTRLLTHRICHLIADKGVNPNHILAITFTNKATNEMRERITEMLPDAYGVWISTFHSMCSRILRESISHFEGYNRFFTIYDSSDRDKILKQILKEFNIEDNDLKNKISHIISDAKNKGFSPDEYSNFLLKNSDADTIINVFKRYENYLKNNNGLDFDDLLVKTLDLFTKFPNVLLKYQDKFRYIHVDEFQDTNLVQYKLIKLLAGARKNVFVVGDEDQCIYGWRGANIQNIFDFRRDFPDCKCYKLEQNYRSTKNILEIANRLIKNNESRMEKELWTNNMEGDKVEFTQCINEIKEAEYVASKIYDLINSHGYESRDIAVLMRLSAHSRLIEEKLLNYNIPYKVAGIFKFFDRQEVKNIVAYLRLLINDRDNEAMLRIINFPKRGIGRTSIDKLIDISNERGLSIYQIVKNSSNYDLPSALSSRLEAFAETLHELEKTYQENNLSVFIKKAVDIIGVKQAYGSKSEEDVDRMLNINQLVQSVIAFDQANEMSDLTNYLESITLSSAVDELDESKNAVSVSTVHASKGLEFNVVFVIGAEDGSFPINRAMDSKDDMEEERRLMYVAITRAKKKLFITQAMSRFIYGDREETRTSRFINEMGLSSTSKPREQYQDSYRNRGYEGYNKSSSFGYNRYTTSKVTSVEDFFKKKLSTQSTTSYEVGMQVLHPKFGVGEISGIDSKNEYVAVKFAGFGVKSLATKFAPLQILKKK